MSFKLFPVEQHWCNFGDYRAIMEATERLQAKSVVEFGPGWSTLALLEGGATSIDCHEDDPFWRKKWSRDLSGWSGVKIHEYGFISGRHYDLAFVDGPRSTEARPPIVRRAMTMATHLLVALELGDGGAYSRAVMEIAGDREVEVIDAPDSLAKAYAVIKC